MANTVLVRIKRFGTGQHTQFATCGVGIMPPADRVDEEGIFLLCPKLVPGQVVELPADHELIDHPTVEVVRSVAADEFLRPWVFESATDAEMANPSKSGLSVEQIKDGLAMTSYATQKRGEEAAIRASARAEAPAPINSAAPVTDENTSRARNRVTQSEAANLRGGDAEPATEPRRTFRRTT